MAYSVNRQKVNESTHTSNKRVAKRALDKRLGEIAEGRLQLPHLQSSPRLSEWSEQFLCGIADANTRARYRASVKNLLRILGDPKLSDLTSDQIERFVQERQSEGVRPATINRDLAVLRRMLKLAQKRQYLVRNPFEQVEMLNETRGRRQARILTFEEERRLMSAIPPNSYLHPLLVLLIETGLRVFREALPLKWEDIDFHNQVVHVRSSKTEAGERLVPLSQYCESTLLQWHQVLGGTFRHVFPNVRRVDAPLRDIHRAWKDLLMRAHVPDMWLHDLRATFASRLSACGLSTFQIAQLLGHSSGRIVAVYAKSFDEGRREAINRLESYRADHQQVVPSVVQ
jgi:integrase